MNCRICKSTSIEAAFIKNNYQILHCSDCGHLFTDLTVTPEWLKENSDDYFNEGGDGYDDYTVEMEMLIKRGEYYVDKLSNYMNLGKVLEIGAAAGFILKGFENKGCLGTGIEPNK